MKRITKTGIAIIGFFALVACGNQTLSERSFDSVTELKSAATEAGVQCGSDDVFESEGAKESIKCGDGVWLSVFDTEDQKVERTNSYENRGTTYTQGPNWVIVGPEKAIQEVSK